jgi:hypothetical protein
MGLVVRLGTDYVYGLAQQAIAQGLQARASDARGQTSSVVRRTGERYFFSPIGSEYMDFVRSDLHCLDSPRSDLTLPSHGESMDELEADENTNENSSTVTPGIETSNLWLPMMKTIRSENKLIRILPRRTLRRSNNQQKILAVINLVI